jgi:hypothetical protein
MRHGAGKNSEVNNLLSLTPCPAARSKPPPRPASRGGDLFRVAQPPGTPACQCRPHVRTGTAQPVQPWRSRIDLVATLVLDQFGNFAAPCRCRPWIDLGARLGFGRGQWQCGQMRVLTAEETRTATQMRRGEGWVVNCLLGAGPWHC